MLEYFFIRTFPGMLRLVAGVFGGVFLGVLVEARGWMEYTSFLMRPLIKLGRLPVVCGTAFMTAFVSGKAANSLLADAYQEGDLTRKELIISGMANTFPATVAHFPRTTFLLIPILGHAGLWYTIIQLATGFFRTFVIILCSRFLLRKENSNLDQAKSAKKKKILSWKDAAKNAFERSLKILVRVMKITLPLYLLISCLSYLGLFKDINKLMPHLIADLIPPSGFTIIVAQMSSLLNAAGVASGFLSSGEIDQSQLLLALLTGYTITIPIRMLRHGLPSSIGIFPVKEGSFILILSNIFRILTIIPVILFLALI